jgi:hypothetical protein
MSETTHPTPAATPDGRPPVMHEESDINLRAVVTFGVVLGVVVTGIGALLLGVFHYFSAREAAAKRSDLPLAAAERGQLPPEPRLEGFPLDHPSHSVGPWRPGPAESQVVNEEERLRQYGWVDEKAGVVHIPVEQAMKLLANKLPARPGTDNLHEGDKDLDAPSAASSGRTPRGGPR